MHVPTVVAGDVVEQDALLGNLEAHSPAMPCASGQGLARVQMPRARGGAPTGERNGRYRHGGRTKAAQADRRVVSKLVCEVRASIARLV
jgi:hypothetical protein